VGLFPFKTRFSWPPHYLRTIFNFVGITDIEFINVQPMDITPDLRRMAITKAIKEARDLVLAVDWCEHLHTEAVEFPLGTKPKQLVE